MTEALELGAAIEEAWRATMVARWHANPDLAGSGDTVGSHSGRAALLVTRLFPNASRDLIVAAILHDLGEAGVGDVAGPAKRSIPELSVSIAQAEAVQLVRLGIKIPDLSVEDTARLRFVDRLDGHLWMRFRAPWLEAKDGWQRDLEWLRQKSEALGLGRSCLGVL